MRRLDLLASLCAGSEKICDIGCDHAYVIIKALKDYGVKYAIASDVALGPLKNAEENVLESGLENRITVKMSDGFENIDEDFDTAIIAGMGGILITNILANSLDKVRNKKLILQPNSDRYIVRKFLYEAGYSITDEYAFIDQEKYYEVIVAEPGEVEYTDTDLTYGPILMQKKEEAFINHYNKLKNDLPGIIERINDREVKREKKLIYEEIRRVIGE